MHYYFCTYFDNNYLPRALCLIDSLNRHCKDYTLYTLCHDNKSFEKTRDLKQDNIFPINISIMEKEFPILNSLKKERSLVEYYYTCGPLFIYYLMKLYPKIDIITYLDADLYFFSDPRILFDQFEGHSIGAVPHQLPENRNNRRWSGIYNVGYLNFRNDKEGIECLELWKNQCLDWCFERLEDGKYADQLYLDQWPKLFSSFFEYAHRGANVAAWNINDYDLSVENEMVYLNNDSLIFFHFHGIKKISNRIYKTNFGTYLHAPNKIFKKYILQEYLNKLENYSHENNPTKSIRKYRGKNHFISSVAKILLGFLYKEYVFLINNRVY